MLKKELLDILVCPIGKAELKYENDTLTCTKCGTKYRVEDDIPIMLIEDAELPEGVTKMEELPCWKEGDSA